MASSPHFRSTEYGREQATHEDLVVEAIAQTGIDVMYLPRRVVAEDLLLGGDPLSVFALAVQIEVYLKDYQAFGGAGDVMTKLGYQIDDQFTMTMAKRRWPQIANPCVLLETGQPLLLETSNSHATGAGNRMLIESGSANGYSITSSRPMEGDLVYVPMVGKVFEIKHVEHENPFYPHGKSPTYDLQCELWRYSSERIMTGETDIDDVESDLSLDRMMGQLLDESGVPISTEEGGYLLLEYRVESKAPSANNEVLRSTARSVGDWSETHPWGEGDRV